jgi:molybdopterin-containing oxidoreductase family iron-sulfur binding subunit
MMSCTDKETCTCASAGSIPAEGKTSPGIEAGRRAFIKAGGAFATVALTPTVTLMAFGGGKANAAQESLDPKARWGLLIDVAKCGTGCNECVTACQKENGWQDTGHPETDAQWIRKVTVKNPKSGAVAELPVMCQHCDEPPCADVCPTGASFKRADGIVLVDKHLCIGCRYCMMACPYKARSFIHEALIDQKPHAPRGKGTVESCTMCVHRVDRGEIPACVESCNSTGGGAMLFGNLNDPQSDIAKRVAELTSTQLRPDLGVDPGVHYTYL